ncbi:hypothetical protein K1T71_010013 [Dendrolimus kikuchii]|uniref:Uncharacterized protein n=1 Tax=Dendrolimus kikuchii TaxID=765133 RepID=A0ACC1CU02_9NEOP|nr:hypothetical protein K1T71_010013 [Dendrolimus kikuchii]
MEVGYLLSTSENDRVICNCVSIDNRRRRRGAKSVGPSAAWRRCLPKPCRVAARLFLVRAGPTASAATRLVDAGSTRHLHLQTKRTISIANIIQFRNQ